MTTIPTPVDKTIMYRRRLSRPGFQLTVAIANSGNLNQAAVSPIE